jgi:hypothetical protein
MDYEGQKLVELIFYWIILAFGIVGWVVGYFQQDFTIVFQAWLAGVVLSVIVSINRRKIVCHGCNVTLKLVLFYIRI